MTLTDILIAVILLAVIGAAAAYIIKAKKSGARCIGCPDSKTCAHKCEGCAGHCSCTQKEE